MEYTWNTDGTVSIAPPKRTRKMTGTRFASVLGLNAWNTPFQMWCEITGAYRMPFEDTIYTLAGKAIEPKQIQYMRDHYAMDNLLDPHDVYGVDPFSQTYGNFFDDPIFGGMWDALVTDEDGNTTGVIEFKTTKRAEDWVDEDGNVEPPEYYALQAALYAYLLDVEDVTMVVSFLEEKDYDHPDKYVCTPDNTQIYDFELHERYPDFEEDYINPALNWWNAHVETGDSPEFDEKKDADYLKAMRSVSLNPTTDIDGLLNEYYKLETKIAANAKKVEKETKRLDVVKKQLKQYAMENIGDKDSAVFGDDYVECKLTQSTRDKIDEAALKKDGLLDKYQKEETSTRFSIKLK